MILVTCRDVVIVEIVVEENTTSRRRGVVTVVSRWPSLLRRDPGQRLATEWREASKS